MKTNFTVLLFLGLLGISGVAFAEGRCPPGQYPVDSPGVSACVPIPGAGEDDHPPPPPRAVWATRWGAIAIDDTNGGMGAVTNMPTKALAERDAIMQCRTKKGVGCALTLVYYNQCGVIAWGDTGYTGAGAATIAEASHRAIQTCARSTSNCRIYYTACSPPERIQ